jgi:hypothetical protein
MGGTIAAGKSDGRGGPVVSERVIEVGVESAHYQVLHLRFDVIGFHVVPSPLSSNREGVAQR